MTLVPIVRRPRAGLALALAVVGAAVVGMPPPAAAQAARAAASASTRAGDRIVAVVNQELVTAVELQQRMALMRASVQAGTRAPPEDQLRQRALESLIEERVVISHAREQGWRIEETEIDRAVQSVASQNQMTMEQLRRRLQSEGLDMARMRADLRDQLMVERTREREVLARIQVSDAEIEREIAAETSPATAAAELNIAQILVAVPEGADAATVTERRGRAEQALQRVRAGESFDAVARSVSEDSNRERGGEIGLRPAERLPDAFVAAVRGLQPGEVAPELLRSGAGFHVLKLLQRQGAAAPGLTETRARHILLRTTAQTTPEQAGRRLVDLRRQIESGARRFEDVAREVSEDTASAAAGGDLGWFAPGVMVPEFEQPASQLPIGALSDPIQTRFGVHLIQVLERRALALDARQRREQVRNVIRERKFQQAYEDWVAEMRGQAYVELRDTGSP
ncbi:MAG: peptidylprolyl isomerase [Rubrivivax sp.]